MYACFMVSFKYSLVFLSPSSGGTFGHLVTQELGWGSRGGCGALPLVCQGLADTAGLG